MKDIKVFDQNGKALSIADVIAMENVIELPKVTRVEAIDEQGRAYVNWKPGNKVGIALQDEGRTLKVFIDN